MASTTQKCTAHIVIEGRVQGVGFRAWVEIEAEARGLDGWVRNRRTGAVEAVFCGDAEAVADMLAACEIGPASARVDKVYRLGEIDDVCHGFAVRPTV